MPNVLLKLLLKDKPLFSRKVPVSVKDDKQDLRGEGNKVTVDDRQTGS